MLVTFHSNLEILKWLINGLIYYLKNSLTKEIQKSTLDFQCLGVVIDSLQIFLRTSQDSSIPFPYLFGHY